MAEITKDMTLGEIVEKHPRGAEIMSGYGLHCVGCGASPWETLEQGVLSHGMEPNVLDALLSELNSANGSSAGGNGSLVNVSSEHNGVVLTDFAASKVKELLSKENKENYGLRISVTPGGCAGFMYEMVFAENPETNDEILEFDGVKVFLDPQSKQMLAGAKIDFVDGLQESGFKIDNPNATSGCGCGKSFS